MKRLLFQSDDYGITRAVSDGILRGVQEGIIRNTGLFVNMESSAYAADRMKNVEVCLGIDINFVAGRPVSNPKDIPHMVNSQGEFYSSAELLKKHKLTGREGLVSIFEEDPYPYEEALLETENQVKRFQELTGKMPGYIHPHSVMTPNTVSAIREMAKKYGMCYSMDILEEKGCTTLSGGAADLKGLSMETQMATSIEKELLETALPTLKEGETRNYICHCGYADAELFKLSSLTLRRMLDLEAALSKDVIRYIKENQIELITYQDL